MIIVRQNNCINFSVCAQWMIWWLHSIYQFISEFYDNCISIQKASINRYSMVVLIYRLVTSSKLLFRKSILAKMSQYIRIENPLHKQSEKACMLEPATLRYLHLSYSLRDISTIFHKHKHAFHRGGDYFWKH